MAFCTNGPLGMNIKRLLKNAIASPVVWPGVARWIRTPGVTVLMYHRIVGPNSLFDGCHVDLFRNQMQWLSRNCHLIGPDEFVHCMNAPRRSRPYVLVTFDDGYRSYFDTAYPVTKELGIPTTVFLATSFIDDGGLIWTDKVTYAVEHAEAKRFHLPWLESHQFDFARPRDREHFIAQAKLHLKGIPNAERKESLLRLTEILGFSEDRFRIERQMMTWDDVRATMDLTTYGGHSHTHPILSQVDKDTMEMEIRTCRDRILNETGQTPKYFAYPNGRLRDFNATTRCLLMQYGFELAFSTVIGSNDTSSDPLALRRIPYGHSISDMAVAIAGLALN